MTSTGPARSLASWLLDIDRVMTGDFNGDGKTDFAAVEGFGQAEPMSIYFVELATERSPKPAAGPVRFVRADATLGPLDISRVRAAGDFNGDGTTDIAAVEGWGDSRP